jgi:hypothetical protein
MNYKVAVTLSIILASGIIIAYSLGSGASGNARVSAINSFEGHSSENQNDSSIVIGNPLIHKESLNFTNIDNANFNVDFIAYEDFPVYLKSQHLRVDDLKIINRPVGTWTKVIRYQELPSGYPNADAFLRIAGIVKPSTPNIFNSTLYLSNARDNQLLGISSMPIIRNGIIEEIAAVKEDVPVRFNNEIIAYPNSTFSHIYGVIYDDANFMPMSRSSGEEKKLDVNIQPIGIIQNGNLTRIPDWLKIEGIGSQFSVYENKPSFFTIIISTQNPPSGSYEIAFRQTVNGKVFTETMIISVISMDDAKHVFKI